MWVVQSIHYHAEMTVQTHAVLSVTHVTESRERELQSQHHYTSARHLIILIIFQSFKIYILHFYYTFMSNNYNSIIYIMLLVLQCFSFSVSVSVFQFQFQFQFQLRWGAYELQYNKVVHKTLVFVKKMLKMWRKSDQEKERRKY